MSDQTKEAKKPKAGAAKPAVDKGKALAKAKADRDKAAKGKAAPAPKAKAEKPAKAPKTPKEKPEPKEPVWVEQLDERGNVEKVDMNKFPIPIACCIDDCDNIRYVNASGALQVTMCKPHARKMRRKRRLVANKAKSKKYGEIIQDALKQGLFPDKFKKKYGLQ